MIEYLQISHRRIAVTGEHAQEAVTSSLLINWAKNLDPRIHVERVRIRSATFLRREVRSLTIDAIMTFDKKRIPGVAFLRGNLVAIFVKILCENQSYSLMTVQPRGPVGQVLVELPEGMMDESGHIIGKTIDELRRKAGFTILPDQLTDLCALAQDNVHAQGIYPSPGGCDEAIRYFLLERRMTRDELDVLEEKATGVLDEGEHITFKIVPFHQLRHIRDGKLMTALGLITSRRFE